MPDGILQGDSRKPGPELLPGSRKPGRQGTGTPNIPKKKSRHKSKSGNFKTNSRYLAACP